MCPSERFLFISFMSWQASPYSKKHDNKLPGSFFCSPCTAVARLFQGDWTVPELAPAAFQELVHSGAVAAVNFCAEAGAVGTSNTVKTNFCEILESDAVYLVLKTSGNETGEVYRVEIQLEAVYSLP